jgi:TolB protein
MSNKVVAQFPKWSPDGTQIVYQRGEFDSAEIYVMNSDGSGQRRLTRNAWFDGHPTWSPDGSQIAFDSISSNGTFSTYVMNADGSSVSLLIDGGYGAALSPDGTRVAFTAPSGSGFSAGVDVYVQNLDGSERRVRLTHDSASRDPAWSPNGKTIAFDSGRSGQEEVYLMNANGGAQRLLTPADSSSLSEESGQPAWSPDGLKIVFDSNRADHLAGQIYSMNPDGSGVRRLTRGSDETDDPSWSAGS